MTLFLASLGASLMRFDLDVEGRLHRLDAIEMDSPIHYCWPHPQRRLLCVAGSGRWFTLHDTDHVLAVVEVPADRAPMRRVGVAVPLRSRPIHVTLDPQGCFVLSLFNDPPGVQVHTLAGDGSIAGEVAQDAGLELGTYPHQVRVSPCGGWVLVAARGNNAGPGRPEDPGSLRRYHWGDGRLRPAQVVAPGGGLGFGPRHLDFHPTLPVIYLSVERQNEIHVYHHQDGVLEPAPRQVIATLDPARRPEFPQYAGAVHVDPAGRFVYLVNRDDPHPGREASHLTGDNSMAAFAIDPRTGTLAAPVHSATGAYHIHTFSLAPPFLVTASQADVALPGPRSVPAVLGVFRMRDDGRLQPISRTDMPTGESMLFWCGFPRAYGAGWD